MSVPNVPRRVCVVRGRQDHWQVTGRESRRPILAAVSRLFFVAALLVALPSNECMPQQQLPFTVTYVDWHRAAFLAQAELYRFSEIGREEMFCVESWTMLPDSAGTERAIIERVRRERTGERLRINDIGALCVGPKGEPLPIIHTHADGNCQFSATDLITVVARRAPFDGIQCGRYHFVWTFAWQVLAIANSIELARFAKETPNQTNRPDSVQARRTIVLRRQNLTLKRKTILF